MGDDEVYKLAGGDEGPREHQEERPPRPEYYGFDVRSVSWGYRRTFIETIEKLLRDGSLGDQRSSTTQTFFNLLKRSEPGSFDFALKEFLGALNRKTKWLLDLPQVFEDFCDLGRTLAEEKLTRGILFFRLWGQGAFGDSPEHIRNLLTHVRSLREVDPELGQAFLTGYAELVERLTNEEINLFVGELKRLHSANPRTAADFAGLRTKSSRQYILALTQEARVDEMRGRLERLGRAIAGKQLQISDLSVLDSDPLIDRNTKLVCFGDCIYFPRRIRICETHRENEWMYLLGTIVCAWSVRMKSFPDIHGHPPSVDVTEWMDGDRVSAALLTLIETVRIVNSLRRDLPGVRPLLDRAIDLEFEFAPPRTNIDHLLRESLQPSEQGREGLVDEIGKIAESSRSCTESRRLMKPLLDHFARIADSDVRSMLFFPDFYYPPLSDSIPSGSLVGDLQTAKKRSAGESPPPTASSTDQVQTQSEEDHTDSVRAAFVYPEWNQGENDYYENWCLLRERTPSVDPQFRPYMDETEREEIRRARRMFERLKPELVRKEKFLSYGDEINIDLLVEYMALKRRIPSPRVRFYEKPFIRKRDIVVAVLLDVSGSTAGPPEGKTAGGAGGKRIIDLEKHAAMTLAEGLDAIGDPFGIYGFSGNSREHCEFFIYKDLSEPFSDVPRGRLMAAYPTASTRMGVAVRHCSEKLREHRAKRKIIILITDGKPQDTGYDPSTRYAQYDVRMACQEARKHDIHVVCISTLENTRSDLEIMFPHRRYVILEDMRSLVDVLPSLYLKMTT